MGSWDRLEIGFIVVETWSPVSPRSIESLGKFGKHHVNRGAKTVNPENRTRDFFRTDVAGSKTLKRNPEGGEESVHGNNPLSGIGANHIVVTIRR
jgi:hypothetical protein